MDSVQLVPKSAKNKSAEKSLDRNSVLDTSPDRESHLAGRIRPRKSRLKEQMKRQERQKSINEAHDAQLDNSDHKRSGLKLPKIPSTLISKEESPESILRAPEGSSILSTKKKRSPKRSKDQLKALSPRPDDRDKANISGLSKTLDVELSPKLKKKRKPPNRNFLPKLNQSVVVSSSKKKRSKSRNRDLSKDSGPAKSEAQP